MSKKYEDLILIKLLKKYEKSKLSTSGSSRNIRISLKLDERNIPEYVNEDSYYYEKKINNAIVNLKSKNFITYTIENGRVKKVFLNLETVEEIYQELEIDSPKKTRNKYLKIAKKYANKGELTNSFSKNVEYIINNYKSYTKYFNTYSELEELFIVLDKLDNQKEEISRRVFSSKYLGDSKRLENILPKIERIIKECNNYLEEDVLLHYNVYKNPTFIYLKGSGIFKVNNQIIDLNKLSSELILSSNHLNNLKILELKVDNIITVENLTSFYNYPINNSLIIYLGGFHNEVRKNFLLKIYQYSPNFNFYHSGDIDAGGFYILNHLINKTTINFIAKNMDIVTLKKYKKYTKQLSSEDKKRLNNLKCQRNMKNYLEVIDYMISNNIKLEQENIDY